MFVKYIFYIIQSNLFLTVLTIPFLPPNSQRQDRRHPIVLLGGCKRTPWLLPIDRNSFVHSHRVLRDLHDRRLQRSRPIRTGCRSHHRRCCHRQIAGLNTPADAVSYWEEEHISHKNIKPFTFTYMYKLTECRVINVLQQQKILMLPKRRYLFFIFELLIRCILVYLRNYTTASTHQML